MLEADVRSECSLQLRRQSEKWKIQVEDAVRAAREEERTAANARALLLEYAADAAHQ